MLRTAAKALNRPDLGLRLAARQDLSTLGVLGLAMANSETVGKALDCASQFLPPRTRPSRSSAVARP